METANPLGQDVSIRPPPPVILLVGGGGGGEYGYRYTVVAADVFVVTTAAKLIGKEDTTRDVWPRLVDDHP